MQQKIGTLRLALTFAGCFLGAGYVSGQELWQYFGAFGARGLLGLALAIVLLGGTGVLLLRLSARTGIETMDALIVRADIPWLRTAVGVLTAALLFGVVCIMAAGIGALGNQMLGLPVWLGAAIACVLIAAAARREVRRNFEFLIMWICFWFSLNFCADSTPVKNTEGETPPKPHKQKKLNDR